MFSQASAILFTRGWCVSQHALWQTPPKADTPLADPHHPLGRHPQADTPGRHPGQTPPLSSACWDIPPCPVHAGMHTPPAPLLSACWDTHTPAQCMLGYSSPTPTSSNCSGRYTSYWKAFLFLCFSAHVKFIQRGTLENSCFLWPI